MVSNCSKVILFFFICLTVTEAWFWRRRSRSRVDCSVSQWSAWSPANSAGQQTRLRRIMRYPRNGGKACPILKETRADCKVTAWSAWSANFGFGQQSRVRTVIIQPIGSGKQCPILEEIRYTGVIPSVNITAKNVQNFFARPNGPASKSSPTKSQTPDLPRDLVIIMDSSGSIGTAAFQVAKEQTSKLIGLLCPNSPFDRIVGFPYQYNQAAMVTYSSDVVTNFNFNTYSTTVGIQHAIMCAVYVGRSTNTYKAFDQARSLFQPGKGVRDATRAKREVLILTDGMSTNQAKTLAAVERLKPVADIYGLMIGSFSSSGMNELTKYVSSPINEHLFYIQNYQQLHDLLELIETEKQHAGANWCAPFNP